VQQQMRAFLGANPEAVAGLPASVLLDVLASDQADAEGRARAARRSQAGSRVAAATVWVRVRRPGLRCVPPDAPPPPAANQQQRPPAHGDQKPALDGGVQQTEQRGMWVEEPRQAVLSCCGQIGAADGSASACSLGCASWAGDRTLADLPAGSVHPAAVGVLCCINVGRPTCVVSLTHTTR
jgi:hypothetical protein